MKTIIVSFALFCIVSCSVNKQPQAYKVTDIRNGKYILVPVVATPQPLKIGDTVYASKGKIKM